MRNQLAFDMVGFSVRNSEKAKIMSIYTVIISALIVISYSLRNSVEGIYSSQVPIYILAFTLIFVLSMMGEYIAIWLKNETPIHLCRCICSFMVIGVALFELFIFFRFGSLSPGEIDGPYSVSSWVAKLVS